MIITRTPFRISFFGGGTDIPGYYLKNGGEVLSTTIDKYLYITCRHMPPFWDYRHRLVYGSKTELVSNLEEIEHPAIRETLRFTGIDYGIDMHYNTDIPAKSGMGSSSSFTVGLLNTLNGMEGKISSKHQLMYDSIHIEQDMIKEPVGSQDQAAAAYGGFNHIIFRKDGGIETLPITIPQKRIQELNDNLIIVFTGFQRFSKDIEGKKIESIDNNTDKLDSIKKYVSDALNILNSDTDIREFGALLNDTWDLKKKLADNVSNSSIDNMYKIGLENGAVGGKLLGAGGGGFMLFFIEPDKKEQLKKALSEFTFIPFKFENMGSQVIYYKEEY